MPGITGIIGAPSELDPGVALKQMMQGRTAASQDTEGTYFNERLGIWVGWTAHKGSFSDCLPIWNATNDVCLIFSGENFADAADLQNMVGGQFAPFTSAAYIVALYEKEGLDCLKRLNGWFCGVLIDLRHSLVVLFNDRYGLKRIYYHQSGRATFFSSEAKSLLRVIPQARQLDLRGLGEVLSCGCALQNRSIFTSVQLLPGGSRWRFAGGTVSKESYFSRDEWEKRSCISEDEFCDRLKETFVKILPRYFRPGERIGMSLTGGLDGRMIMAWTPAGAAQLPCYTFGGTYRACADVRIAQRVAEACGQVHQIIPVNGEFLGDFRTLAQEAIYASDGAMDVSGSVELWVNRIAKRIAPIRLTGNYGSEILRGYVAFSPAELSTELFSRELNDSIGEATETYNQERRCHPLSFVAFKQVPWFHFCRFSIEQSELTPRSPYLDNDLVALMYQAPEESIRSKGPSLRLIAEGKHGLMRIPTDRGIVYGRSAWLNRIRALFEEVAARAEYAYDYGMPHWLARVDKTMAPLRLERLFLGRQKFCHFRIWYRDQLGAFVKEVLLDGRSLSRPYLRRSAVEQIVKQHTDGTRNYTRELHQLLTLELIQRQLIERN